MTPKKNPIKFPTPIPIPINKQKKQIIAYIRKNKMNEYDSFLSTVSQKERTSIVTQPKFISANKWHKHMIDCLKMISVQYHQKKNLVVDLTTIVSSVSEESIVEATLKIRPFKPEFQAATSVLTFATQSTMAETVTKNVKYTVCKLKEHEDNKKRIRITEKTLTQQFNKDYHPFKFIIKNFARLLELKFKSCIDSKKMTAMNAVVTELKSDMAIFSQFFHKAAQPYRKLFKITNNGEEEQINKYEQFLETFIQQNEKLNRCHHKILTYACTTFYQQKIQSVLPNQVDIEEYKLLPEDFKIDGCYIRTIDALMSFSELRNPDKIMKKLVQIRENILIDISEFYLDHKQQKQLEVSAEVQIEIIRFCLAKLKNWAISVLASLKFLEFVYGDEEMGYKYEESSYMYTQLSMAFQIMGVD